VPRGLAYWEAVNELIQREPVEERDRFFYDMLRGLGIEKGKRFAPDGQYKRLLEDAVLLGEELSKALVYEKRTASAEVAVSRRIRRLGVRARDSRHRRRTSRGAKDAPRNVATRLVSVRTAGSRTHAVAQDEPSHQR
jgi:hypothetical protein